MPDISTLLILLTLTNKNGFNSIKHAIEAADNFSNRIQSISNIMNVLPSLSSLFSSNNGNALSSLLNGFMGSSGQNNFSPAFAKKEDFVSKAENQNDSASSHNQQAKTFEKHPYVDTIEEKLSKINSR